jgi:hypothetical protein
VPLDPLTVVIAARQNRFLFKAAHERGEPGEGSVVPIYKGGRVYLWRQRSAYALQTKYERGSHKSKAGGQGRLSCNWLLEVRMDIYDTEPDLRPTRSIVIR